ncbi:Transferase [Melia azedarach]|uniref:Transferase n=1 Tax=Melia azedarach TaxID=155640 RepID=A0ACC1XVR3_MELAZ|nr:Transferase [Melia azedarach]
MIKRFVFDGNKIATLREKIKNTRSDLDRPTSFEAVSALIWGAILAIARENNESAPAVSIPVNLRKRMNPPLPEHCIGNIIHSATANWLTDEEIDLNSLTRNIREAVKMVSDTDYVRKVYAGDSFVNQLKKISEEIANIKVRMFGLSSWRGLPYYEIDFGWGRPRWVSTVIRVNDVAILLDAFDGKGIEVWVALPHKDMAKFQQDVGILTYASFNPSL